MEQRVLYHECQFYSHNFNAIGQFNFNAIFSEIILLGYLPKITFWNRPSEKHQNPNEIRRKTSHLHFYTFSNHILLLMALFRQLLFGLPCSLFSSYRKLAFFPRCFTAVAIAFTITSLQIICIPKFYFDDLQPFNRSTSSPLSANRSVTLSAAQAILTERVLLLFPSSSILDNCSESLLYIRKSTEPSVITGQIRAENMDCNLMTPSFP